MKKYLEEYGLIVTDEIPKQTYRKVTKDERDRTIESHRKALLLAEQKVQSMHIDFKSTAARLKRENSSCKK